MLEMMLMQQKVVVPALATSPAKLHLVLGSAYDVAVEAAAVVAGALSLLALAAHLQGWRLQQMEQCLAHAGFEVLDILPLQVLKLLQENMSPPMPTSSPAAQLPYSASMTTMSQDCKLMEPQDLSWQLVAPQRIHPVDWPFPKG